MSNIRAAPTYGALAHTCVWSAAVITTVIPAIQLQEGLGLSIFNWCWISVKTELKNFILLSLFLYYIPHLLIWISSTVVLIFALFIFWGGRFAASSETRKSVMKQNVVYVLVLGLETALIIPLWIIQLILLKIEGQDLGNPPRFYTNADVTLAVIFAIIHSLRGTIDLIVWWVTFSIGPSDFKDLYQQVRARLRPRSEELAPSSSMHTPLIRADTAVNRALRRDAIYCINIGILDAVKLNVDQRSRDGRLGSVREPFVAQAMMNWEEQNRHQETEDRLAANPYYSEQTERKITFPPSASIQKFAFQDLEPTVFDLLRQAYGISSSEYRQSFKLRNAADVESSGMLEKFTEGKSGSFFYFSHNFRYIIKTVTSEEEKFLRKIAYRYYNHMKRNPNSLIVRFFGLHKVRLAPEQRYISVVVMENIFFHNRHQLKMSTIYDLKGSSVGRRSLKGSRTRATYHGTLKDLDFEENVWIGGDAKTQLMEQLDQDVKFLTKSGIMDYSLLLGIHNHASSRPARFESESLDFGGGDTIVDVNLGGSTRPSFSSMASPQDRRSRQATAVTSFSESQGKPAEPRVQWFRQDMGGLRSCSPFHPCIYDQEQRGGGEPEASMSQYPGMAAQDLPVATYFFGVVDILQEYNVRKKIENFWKTKIVCRDKRGISAVNQQEYGERFLRAMDRIFQ
jgi:hypothetical protein